MKLRLALEEKNYDIRLRDRLLAEGKLKQEDLKEFLENTEDAASNAEPLKNYGRTKTSPNATGTTE